MLIALKLILTPLIMTAASLAGRRWGDAIAGWLTGLPVVSGPVSVYLALEHGDRFAALAAAGSVSGVVSQAAFCIAYSLVAPRGWSTAALAATLAYVGMAAMTIPFAPPLLGLIGLAAAALVVARLFLPADMRSLARVSAPRWDIPLRAAVATLLVMAVTTFAAEMGPRISGVTASYPVITGSIAVFAHRAQGPQAAVAALRGMTTALFGFM